MNVQKQRQVLRQMRMNRDARDTERAALVTEELASLLEKVGNLAGGSNGWTSIGSFTSQDGERCREIAASIREACLPEHRQALALEGDDE